MCSVLLKGTVHILANSSGTRLERESIIYIAEENTNALEVDVMLQEENCPTQEAGAYNSYLYLS